MFNDNPNRIARYFPEPKQSIADRLLAGAWACKIEMIRFEGDDGDECSIEVELKTSLTNVEGNAAEVAELVRQFRKGGEGAVSQ